MRKTYKSSNVRFCMEDENQRRTWEYLQSLTRKDSSYGKAQRAVRGRNGASVRDGYVRCHDVDGIWHG